MAEDLEQQDLQPGRCTVCGSTVMVAPRGVPAPQQDPDQLTFSMPPDWSEEEKAALRHAMSIPGKFIGVSIGPGTPAPLVAGPSSAWIAAARRLARAVDARQALWDGTPEASVEDDEPLRLEVVAAMEEWRALGEGR